MEPMESDSPIQSERGLLLIYFLFAAGFLFLVFAPTLFIPYVHRDDYHFWTHHFINHDCCDINLLMARGILEGRGLAMFPYKFLSTLVYTSQDLAFVRIFSILFLSGSLALFALFLFKQIGNRWLAFFISGAIMVLPGIQYHIFLVTLLPATFLILIVMAASILTLKVHDQFAFKKEWFRPRALALSAGVIVLLMVGFNIYQPTTLFFLAPLLAVFLFKENINWQEKRNRLVHGISLLAIAMVAYYICQRWITTPLLVYFHPEFSPEKIMANYSMGISTDVAFKFQLFINDISFQSFNLWNIFPKKWLEYFVIIFIFAGCIPILYNTVKEGLNGRRLTSQFWKFVQTVGIVITMFLISSAPNLLAKFHHTAYRTQIAYMALIALLAIWSFLSLANQIPEKWRGWLVNGAGVILLVVTGLSANKNMINGALNSYSEISFIRSRLISHLPKVPDMIHFIVPTSCSYINKPCRHGEFNPANISWNQHFIVNLISHETGIYVGPKKLPPGSKRHAPNATVYIDPSDLVIDMNELLSSPPKKEFKIFEVTNARKDGFHRWAFNNYLYNFWEVRAPFPFWINLEFKSDPKPMSKYLIQMGAHDDTGKMPRDWELTASNDGNAWTTLDVRKDETGWKKNEARTYAINEPSIYKHYRLTILKSNDPNSVRLYSIKLLD